ncbi:hypothetical protein J2046_004717 [Rhizobium petrolearium]|nr:hypothetical protein [Neorhizobium petrolearium]
MRLRPSSPQIPTWVMSWWGQVARKMPSAVVAKGGAAAICSKDTQGDVLPHLSYRILPFNLATSRFYSELMARSAIWEGEPHG